METRWRRAQERSKSLKLDNRGRSICVLLSINPILKEELADQSLGVQLNHSYNLHTTNNTELRLIMSEIETDTKAKETASGLIWSGFWSDSTDHLLKQHNKSVTGSQGILFIS